MELLLRRVRGLVGVGGSSAVRRAAITVAIGPCA